MQRVERAAVLLAAALALPALAGSIPAAATEATAPLAVESFGYPDGATVLDPSSTGATLKTGDGNIRLADCASGTDLLRVRYTGNHETCFKVTGASGYLSMEIPAVFRIMSDNHAVKATMSADGTTSSVDLIKNEWKEVGVGANGPESMLLDLTATDGTAATIPTPEFPAVGSLNVGPAGRAGSRGCTATLVDPLWVLTSAGCFTDNPGSLAAGSPSAKSTFTAGGHTVDIAELAPRTDRDTVLARLATPITDVTPLKLATTAAASGTTAKVAGFGRTATTWGTGNGPRTTNQTVGTVSGTDIALTPATGAVPVCAGDTGAPLINTAGAITGTVSRAWQAGCLATPITETRTSATAARTDDLGTWVQQVVDVHPGSALFAVAGDKRIWSAQGSYATAVWNGFTPVPGNSDMRQVSAVTMGKTQRLFAVAGDQRIWSADRNPATGTWSAFSPVPNNSGIKQVVAVPMGDKVRLFAIGSTNQIFSATGDYTAGTWSTFQPIASSGIKEIAAAAVGNTVRLFAIGSTDQIFTITGDYTAGTWSSWQSVPGSAIQHIAVTAVGDKIRLFAIGSDKQVWATDSTGSSWSTYTAVPGATNSAQVAAVTLGDTVRLFNADVNGTARTADLPNGGTWTASYTISSSALQSLAATATG